MDIKNDEFENFKNRNDFKRYLRNRLFFMNYTSNPHNYWLIGLLPL